MISSCNVNVERKTTEPFYNYTFVSFSFTFILSGRLNIKHSAGLDSICSEMTLLWMGSKVNIKLSLCKTKRYEAGNSLHFLSEHQIEVSYQLYALAVLPLVSFD
jgi:hypothetical protein